MAPPALLLLLALTGLLLLASTSHVMAQTPTKVLTIVAPILNGGCECAYPSAVTPTSKYCPYGPKYPKQTGPPQLISTTTATGNITAIVTATAVVSWGFSFTVKNADSLPIEWHLHPLPVGNEYEPVILQNLPIIGQTCTGTVPKGKLCPWKVGSGKGSYYLTVSGLTKSLNIIWGILHHPSTNPGYYLELHTAQFPDGAVCGGLRAK